MEQVRVGSHVEKRCFETVDCKVHDGGGRSALSMNDDLVRNV